MVLDSFIKTSATGGLGSIKAEVMADTAVALASGNVKLVSSKVRLSLRLSLTNGKKRKKKKNAKCCYQTKMGRMSELGQVPFHCLILTSMPA